MNLSDFQHSQYISPKAFYYLVEYFDLPSKYEHRPLVWHKNPAESIWVYGDRMFKTQGNTAYIDNPVKRKAYQKAVLKSIMQLIKR